MLPQIITIKLEHKMEFFPGCTLEIKLLYANHVTWELKRFQKKVALCGPLATGNPNSYDVIVPKSVLMENVSAEENS